MHSKQNPPAHPPDTFPCLDGLRGFAALWVLASHVQILSGMPSIRILSWGGLAVDLFMMLSGLLMAHHYLLRQSAEPWGSPRTWLTFWTRRFFRIAPLYYVLLAVATVLAPSIGHWRNSVAAVWPGTATTAARYAGFDLTNVLAHLTFVFGALPDYAFRTPLPDWSIGLEMQFYLAFPFVMLVIASLGLVRGGVLLVMLCLALKWMFVAFFNQFEMPSALPLKLYAFIIGIWLACGRSSGRMTISFIISLVTACLYAVYERTTEAAGLVVLVLLLFYLLSDGSLPIDRLAEPLLRRVRQVLSNQTSKHLGDASYGLYLVHLLILIPVAGFLATKPGYVALPNTVRFALCFSITTVAGGFIAWTGYRLVELPGIRLGKKFTRRIHVPIRSSVP